MSVEYKKLFIEGGIQSCENRYQKSLTRQKPEQSNLPKDGRAVEVEVQHLVKTFGKQEAVKDISFTIGRGEIFGLLGPNGAGKSTTINIMCGYLEPTSGDTLIDRKSITREPRKVKRMIGVVPQEIALYNDLMVCKSCSSNSLEKHYATNCLREQSFIDRKKENIHGIYTTS